MTLHVVVIVAIAASLLLRFVLVSVAVNRDVDGERYLVVTRRFAVFGSLCLLALAVMEFVQWLGRDFFDLSGVMAVVAVVMAWRFRPIFGMVSRVSELRDRQVGPAVERIE